MSDNILPSIKGQLLLAMPGLPDPNFAQAVVCICEHNEFGALGLLINKIHPLLTGRELFEDLEIKCDDNIDKVQVYFGGPVQTSGVFILHGKPFKWQESLQITDNLALTNSKDILRAIATQKGPELFMIILGCAGWGPMQLDNELNEASWLICPSTKDLIFNVKNEFKYEKAMMNIE